MFKNKNTIETHVEEIQPKNEKFKIGLYMKRIKPKHLVLICSILFIIGYAIAAISMYNKEI